MAPLYLGIEQGFFEEEGLDVRPAVAQGGAAIIPAVVSGDQQIGFSNIVSLLIGQTEDLPVQVISQGIQATDDPENDTAAIAVPGDSDIQTVQDLEGKTIAINTLRNISELTVKAALEGEGVDVSTLTFVEVPLPDMVGQLEAGQVDAAGLVEPFVTTGKDAGFRMLIYDRVATEPEMTVATYFTSNAVHGVGSGGGRGLRAGDAPLAGVRHREPRRGPPGDRRLHRDPARRAGAGRAAPVADGPQPGLDRPDQPS